MRREARGGRIEGCARWFSTQPVSRSGSPSFRIPSPPPSEVLLRVRACGVCRTDLHIVDGELTEPKLPLVLGPSDRRRGRRRRVAIRSAASASACPGSDGRAANAASASPGGRTSATGRASPATTSTAATRSSRSRTSATASPFRTGIPDEQAAPLLCAGLIGYRSLRLAGDAESIGLYGFGASAHIVCQVAVAQGRRVFAGTRAGDDETQAFARSLGASWAGDALAGPPEELDAVHRLRAGRASSCRPRSATSARAAPWSAPGST